MDSALPRLAGSGARRVSAGYWAATTLVCSELLVGGVWDVQRFPQVSSLTAHLGYPSYFLVLLGLWKLLGALALFSPRLPLLKEWAYAGVMFTDTGAIASHLTMGYSIGELTVLVPLAALTVLSWALRPPSRRLAGTRRQ
jgi:hypothetical protein